MEFFHLTLSGDAKFDPAALRRDMASHLPILDHPNPPHTAGVVAVVCANESMMQRLESDPKAIGYQGFVTLRPSHLTIDVLTTQEILHLMSDYFVPLIRDRHCNILDENGSDVTSRFEERPQDLFEP
jgi:hypothetical protein